MQQIKAEHHVIKLLLILLLSMISLGIAAMTIGLGLKLVLFSAVHGQVVDRGKPVIGATVNRYYNWYWTNAESTDQAVTDKEGRFSFKRISTLSLTASLFPHQPVIVQTIDIRVDSKVFEAWHYMKMNYDNNGELCGKAIDVICDIGTEPEWRGKIFGISRIL